MQGSDDEHPPHDLLVIRGADRYHGDAAERCLFHEKRAALAHLEPQSVLISRGAARAERRRFNEEVLEPERPAHDLVESFLSIVDDEAGRILAAPADGELDWGAFAGGWFRLVRRVIFGNSAADDRELSELTAELRRAANWAFLRPPKTDAQARFFSR